MEVNKNSDEVTEELLKKELQSVRDELESLKIVISISEQSNNEEIENIKKHCEQDILSIRQILKEAQEESNASHLTHRELLSMENNELKAKVIVLEATMPTTQSASSAVPGSPTPSVDKDREGFLSTLSKSFQKKSQSPNEQDPDNLEYIMEKAKESNEILKSVVMPLEREINSLKKELAQANNKVRAYKEGSLTSHAGGVCLDDVKSSSCDNAIRPSGQNPDLCSPTSKQLASCNEVNELLVSQLHSVPIEEWQSLQKETLSLTKEVTTLQRKAEKDLQTMESLREQLDSVQGTLQTANNLNSKKISEITKNLYDNETTAKNMRTILISTQSELEIAMRATSKDRKHVHTELTRLQNDNDFLIARHSATATQLQDEAIDLPNNIEELQLLILKNTQELIRAKVAKEYAVQKYQTELQFVKDQNISEQNERCLLETSLTDEIAVLRRDKINCRKVENELKKERTLKDELSAKVAELETEFSGVKNRSRDTIDTLQNQAQVSTSKKTELESQIRQLKIRLHTLQVDYDNSEAVQQDFVKLSQSLQVQLENLRSSEHEVRFQHEDDYDNCNDCHEVFVSNKKKHHCRHCGHLFCPECLNQKVISGPNRRPMSVCRVCHTMLVQEATPYFSQS